jgi:hypothetical protein
MGSKPYLRVTSENFAEIQGCLQVEFPWEDIEWRVKKTDENKKRGMALPYVTNRAIQNRLDEIFTPFGWRNEYKDWHGNSQLCGISIKFIDENGTPNWITKWDGADNTDFEAVKGGLSDSMKRSAVQWGIGRYLYSLPAPWVNIEAKGKSCVIAKHEYARLRTLIDTKKWDEQNEPLSTIDQENSQSTDQQQSQSTGKNNPSKDGVKKASKGQKEFLVREIKISGLTIDQINALPTYEEADKAIKAVIAKKNAQKEAQKNQKTSTDNQGGKGGKGNSNSSDGKTSKQPETPKTNNQENKENKGKKDGVKPTENKNSKDTVTPKDDNWIREEVKSGTADAEPIVQTDIDKKNVETSKEASTTKVKSEGDKKQENPEATALYIAVGQKGLIDGLVKQVALHKKNTSESIESMVKNRFKVDSIKTVKKDDFNKVVSYLKSMIA